MTNRYTKRDLPGGCAEAYAEEFEAAMRAKLVRVGFFEDMFQGFTYRCGCLCGGKIFDTPDKRLLDGRFRFGGYKCNNANCRYPNIPNSGWPSWTLEEKAVWATLARPEVREKQLAEALAGHPEHGERHYLKRWLT